MKTAVMLTGIRFIFLKFTKCPVRRAMIKIRVTYTYNFFKVKQPLKHKN